MLDARPHPYRMIAVALVAIVLAGLAIETTVRDVARQSGVSLPIAWVPDDARMLLRRSGLDEGVLLNRRDLQGEVMVPARRARAIDPLDPLPLVIAGTVAREAGRDTVALAAFRAGQRIDPRLFLARYQLMQQLVETGAVGEGVDEIISSANLVSDYDSALMPTLATASTAPDLRRRVIAGLTRFPAVRQRMIDYMSRAGDDDGLLQELLRLGTDRKTLDAAIGNLARRGWVSRALSLWRSTYRPPASAFDGYVFDGAFEGRPAPSLMGWQRQPDAGLSIALGASDGAPGQLQLTAFGTVPAAAVRQSLALPVGTYRLTAAARANGQDPGGAFVWSIGCGDNGAALASLPFAAGTGKRDVKAATFTVPAGCRSQTLTLSSSPSDTATSYSIAFDAISVHPE